MTLPTRKPYPSDLTDDQWNLIAPLIPPKIGKGEDRKVDLREVVNGILYVLRNRDRAKMPENKHLISK